MFPKCSGIETIYTLEGDITTFCWKNFNSQCQKVSWRNGLTIQKNSGTKKMHKKRGITTVRWKSVLSHCGKKLRGNPSVFQKICSLEKCLWIAGWWCITSSRRNFFCLPLPKNSVSGPCNSETFWCGRFFCIIGVSWFFWKHFGAKTCVGDPSLFPKCSGIEKIWT